MAHQGPQHQSPRRFKAYKNLISFLPERLEKKVVSLHLLVPGAVLIAERIVVIRVPCQWFLFSLRSNFLSVLTRIVPCVGGLFALLVLPAGAQAL